MGKGRVGFRKKKLFAQIANAYCSSGRNGLHNKHFEREKKSTKKDIPNVQKAISRKNEQLKERIDGGVIAPGLKRWWVGNGAIVPRLETECSSAIGS